MTVRIAARSIRERPRPVLRPRKDQILFGPPTALMEAESPIEGGGWDEVRTGEYRDGLRAHRQHYATVDEGHSERDRTSPTNEAKKLSAQFM
jgi:hypothetical protein